MDSRIRYLAIGSERPEKLAQFYTTYFGMKQLGRSGSGDIALTERGAALGVRHNNHYNLSFLLSGRQPR